MMRRLRNWTGVVADYTIGTFIVLALLSTGGPRAELADGAAQKARSRSA